MSSTPFTVTAATATPAGTAGACPGADLGTVAGALAAERRRLRRVIAEIAAHGLDQRTEEDDLGEVASASQHPADVATETFEREVELGLLEEFSEALAALDDAQQRLVDGTYGTCEHCHGLIGHERLRAVPATRWCLSCAVVMERARRWPTGRSARVLLDDEFLASDDLPDGRDGDIGVPAEEAAVTVRDVLGAD